MRLLVEWSRVCVWLAAVVKSFLKISHVNSRKLMEYALWFYAEDEFPVFQGVYADLNVPFLGTMVSGRHPFRR